MLPPNHRPMDRAAPTAKRPTRVSNQPATRSRTELFVAVLFGITAFSGVGLLVRAGPDKERPLVWVTYGAALVVFSWIVISVLFGLYLAEIANYQSIFGNLATVFVVIEYVYISSIVFITGILVDSLTRGATEGGRGRA